MKRIVFVSIGSLEKYLYDALCIDVFFQSLQEVVFLDVSNWLFCENKKQKCDFVQSINSKEEFEKAITQYINETTYFNIQIHYEDRFYSLFRLLKSYDCQLCRFEIGYLPDVKITHRLQNYLLKPRDMTRRIKEKILSLFARKTGLIKLDFDFIFCAGSVALDIASKKAKKRIPINYVDYEYYREYIINQHKTVVGNRKYAVFLDINLAYHEDMSYDPALKRLDAKQYISALNNFFDIVEKNLGLEVVIAMHPKAQYASGTFCNRKVFKNKTAELVFYSDLVISHNSTAISYAILGKKPAFLVYTTEMQKLYGLNIMPFMEVLSDEIEAPLINIDLVNNLSIPKVSKCAYNSYKYKYLTSIESQNTTNHDIISNFLKEV